jgi:uncharacterized iron-regulated membrane protein
MTKIEMRNAWFQVHKWIGLILAILIIPICISGSALVWNDALDRLVNPARYATSGTGVLAAPMYAAAAERALPAGAAIASLKMPEEAGAPVVVSATVPGAAARPGPPARLNVYLDPPTARVLDQADSRSGLLRTLHVLHGSLMVPGVGRQVVGWIGVAMLLSSISGLWLWWPTVGKWVRGLRWRRHRNLDTNLHHMMGFWIALPLFVLSLTGAWISFPQFFGRLTGEGQRQGARRGPPRAALARAKPLSPPQTPLETALAQAEKAAPGDVRQVTWPTDVKPEWSIALDKGSVSVADADGVATVAAGGERRSGGVARLMRTIHDGHDTPFIWQVIVFLGGLLPALLAITGVIMWWRARGWKGEMAARKRRAAAAAAAE